MNFLQKLSENLTFEGLLNFLKFREIYARRISYAHVNNFPILLGYIFRGLILAIKLILADPPI